MALRSARWRSVRLRPCAGRSGAFRCKPSVFRRSRMTRSVSRSVLTAATLLSIAILALGAAPAGAQLIYTAPTSTGLFAGVNAGNGTLTGTYNTGIGYDVLLSVTSGFWNTAVGADALTSATTATSNTGIGVG